MTNLAPLNPQKYTCFLIDLDDTLYHHDNGAWELIRNRIHQYIIEKINYPLADVAELRDRLWHQYGTTLRGLQTEFSVDAEDYLDYVHDVPLESILSPDPQLDSALASFPQRKSIFTNAHAPHASRVMKILGVEQHFENIIDICAIAPYCKPQEEAFYRALSIVDESPETCLFIDDSPPNLETAKSLGMGTVCVGKHHHNGSPHIDTILQLSSLFIL
jgi:putative hydrolase of the HAD superfamily